MHRSDRATILTVQRFCAWLAAVIALFLFPSPEPCRAGEQPSVQVENLAGQRINPFLPKDATAIVFVFLSVDCPACNQYAPELHRLKTEFETNGVVIKLVYPNPDETGETLRQHAKDYDLDLEQLRDASHALVKSAGARVTPEAAVYVPKRGFIYCGRIDNRFARLGVARVEITEHELREVLTSVVEGKPSKKTENRGVGCAIPELR